MAAVAAVLVLSVRPGVFRTSRTRTVTMHDSGDAFSLEALSSRIAALKEQPEPERVTLLMLNPMVPRQRYTFDAPAQLLRTIEGSEHSLVVIEPQWEWLHIFDEHDRAWKPDAREQAASAAGVEVAVTAVGPRSADGSATVTLVAGRWCDVVEAGTDEGSPLLARSGTVCWRALDAHAPEEQPTPAVLERSVALEALVDEWKSLVRATGSETSPQQLDEALLDQLELGEMPPAARPSDRALWVAALLCPVTSFGVAPEIRPAVLSAPSSSARVGLVEAALEESIERLRRVQFFSSMG